jgi:hypothetical protein
MRTKYIEYHPQEIGQMPQLSFIVTSINVQRKPIC